jgi:hypothetical protein
MKTNLQKVQSSARVAAGVLLLLLSAPLGAEVGVILDAGTGSAQGPYEIGAIIEDGNPVTAMWQPHSPPESDRAILNPDGELNGDGRPSSVFNIVSGLPIVAWAKSSPGGYDVVVSRFVEGAWTDPLVLAEDATFAEPAEPTLLIDPAGGAVHLLYWTDDAWPRVMHREAPADLSSWTAPVQVSQPCELAVRPAGVFHQGALYVVYEVHTSQLGGTPRQIVLAWEDGGGYSSEVVATSGHDTPNRPQVHSASDMIWIEWVDADGEMRWTRRETPGPWDPLEVETFATSEQREYHVRGAIKGRAMQ